MTYSEVKKELKKEFNNFLKPLGYKSKCSNQGCTFSLKKEDREFKLGYGIINQIDEFYTSVHGSLGVYSIQNIEKEIFGEDEYSDTLLLNKSKYFNDMQWKAGLDKLKHKGWTDANALSKMKNQWKSVFENKADDIFNTIWDNQSLKNSLFDSGLTKAEAKIDFLVMVEDTDDVIFKFIKVE